MWQIALQRGVEFLWSAQADDGGWHSATYGALRPGAAVTSLVLYALSCAEPVAGEMRADRARRASEFLRRGLTRRGCVACPDGTLDYPVYATALALRTQRDGWELWNPNERRTLAEYLLRAQLTESRGFPAGHLDAGGWDVAGYGEGRGVTTGSNISLARHATTALKIYHRELPEVDPSRVDDVRFTTTLDEALAAARRWTLRCQAWPEDGGFHFAPQPAALDNKAAWSDDKRQSPRSYGSATCDGVLALHATGLAVDDPHCAAAVRWLGDHAELNRVPGFVGASEADWADSLWFYYLAALNESLPLLAAEVRAERRETIVRQLVERQRNDGSWSNSASRMREDDPLIATALAVVALRPTA